MNEIPSTGSVSVTVVALSVELYIIYSGEKKPNLGLETFMVAKRAGSLWFLY